MLKLEKSILMLKLQTRTIHKQFTTFHLEQANSLSERAFWKHQHIQSGNKVATGLLAAPRPKLDAT
jgi:hypothetical protein